MEIIKDVTFHSCWGYRISIHPPHSTWATHVFLSLGRDALHSGSTPVLLAPWDSSCKFLKKLPLLHEPRSLCKLLCVSIPEISALKLFKTHAVSTFDSSNMASDDSSSSRVNAETRIGSLEAAMGRLRLKLDDNDKKLDAVSKAGEKSWDLLNNELR